MSNSNKVKVQIDDMNFVVVGGDSEEYVKGLATVLNGKIEETRNSNYRLNQFQSLVLTALNILDEKEKAIQSKEKLVSVTEDENKALETINELKEAKEEIQKLESNKIKYDSIIADYNINIKELEKENRKLKNTIDEKENREKELLLEIDDSKEEIRKLEEQIYDAQKRVIDLNRELESLTDHEE